MLFSMNVSLTLQGWVLLVLSMLVKAFEIDLDEGQLTEIASWIAAGIAAAVIYVGRYRQGDITWYGKKIKK